MRHTADDVCTLFHRLSHQLGRARVANDAFLRKRNGGHFGEVAAFARSCHHSLQRDQATDRVDVDVRSQPGRPRHGRASNHLEGAQPHVLDRVLGLEFLHAADRASQRAIVLGSWERV